MEGVRVSENSRDVTLGVSNRTIIPLTLVGYEIVIANEARSTELAIYHLISNARSWNTC